MNTTSQDTIAANILPTDNLTTPLQSAVFIPLDASKGRAVAAGNRYCKLIKKGINSKLGASVAVEVPSLRDVASYMLQPLVAEAVQEYIQSLQDAQIKSRAVAGAREVQYSELTPAALELFLATSEDTGRIGQLSSERIVAWFEASARELLIVALADRLGISETASDADVKRLEQIANQTRDNLAKLSSKKPVHFDIRVLNALNWALAAVESDDDNGMSGRLAEKLNLPVVSGENMADALGF